MPQSGGCGDCRGSSRRVRRRKSASSPYLSSLFGDSGGGEGNSSSKRSPGMVSETSLVSDPLNRSNDDDTQLPSRTSGRSRLCGVSTGGGTGAFFSTHSPLGEPSLIRQTRVFGPMKGLRGFTALVLSLRWRQAGALNRETTPRRQTLYVCLILPIGHVLGDPSTGCRLNTVSITGCLSRCDLCAANPESG